MTDSRPRHGPYWLDPYDPSAPFPPVDAAAADPNGLLAFGGDLSPQRLLRAYRQGIFPWYSEGQPILWWSPNPRSVLFPSRLKVSRSLRKTLRNRGMEITFNRAFSEVVRACAAPREDTNGTWLVPEMIQAYDRLHELGAAHSVECWSHGRLVGGLYGLIIGRVFFGESMFSRVSDASKVAFVRLVERLRQGDFAVIDCQVHSAHLASLGAEEIPRSQFIALLDTWCEES